MQQEAVPIYLASRPRLSGYARSLLACGKAPDIRCIGVSVDIGDELVLTRTPDIDALAHILLLDAGLGSDGTDRLGTHGLCSTVNGRCRGLIDLPFKPRELALEPSNIETYINLDHSTLSLSVKM